MLDTLVTSKMRMKLLLKFFSNSGTRAYLRGLADEFGESSNAVRVELNRLHKAGLLTIEEEGRSKFYRANPQHSLFPEISSIVKKFLGLDKVESILAKLGTVEFAFVTGDYAKGVDSGIIDLVVVGRVDITYLNELVAKTEAHINRKVRTLVLSNDEFQRLEHRLKVEKSLVLWNAPEQA